MAVVSLAWSPDTITTTQQAYQFSRDVTRLGKYRGIMRRRVSFVFVPNVVDKKKYVSFYFSEAIKQMNIS